MRQCLKKRNKSQYYYFICFCCLFCIFKISNILAQPTATSYYKPYPLQSATNQTPSPSDITNLEMQAIKQGYTPQQINSYKQRLEKNNQSVYSPEMLDSDSNDLFDEGDSLAIVTEIDSNAIVEQDSILAQADSVEAEKSRYFGYFLFKNIPEAFKPNIFGPVDPGYNVGPGDVLRLSVWGEVEFQYDLKISKEGKIFIPVAGQVYVSGVPFENLQSKIQTILSKHYSGLASQPQKSFMDLSIAQIRPIRIFVMGELEFPGGYTVSSSSTAFNALYSTGGPLTTGTMRDIKVIRQGQELATIDIYQYISSGKCSTDVRLQNDDVIFIPKRGKTVSIIGSVFKPAIYELKENENILALLEYCGSILPESNINHALIHRVLPLEQRKPTEPSIEVINLKLYPYLIKQEDFNLYNNDTLKIIPLSNDLRNYVQLNGEVHYPGMYECDSLSLYTLIFTLGKPIETKAFDKRVDIIRRNDDKISCTTIPVNLEKLRLDSASYDQYLQPFDEVIIYEKEVEKSTDCYITIDGEVRQPGTYLMSSNHSIPDILLQAGGFTRGAFRNTVDIYRLKPDKTYSDTLTEVFQINLPDSVDYNDPNLRTFRLNDRDRIVVRPNPDYILDNYVKINGLVKFTGKYALQKRGERLSDIIERAGGILPDAFLEGATVTRNEKRLVINFSEALSGATSKENIRLQKNDSIYIPFRPNAVFISGNVNNPGLFSFVQSLKLRDYINRAGGFADSTAFILLTGPGGETSKIRRNSFKNPSVLDGSEIFITKKVAKDKSVDKQGPSIAEVIRDTLAIIASSVTVIGLVIQLNN